MSMMPQVITTLENISTVMSNDMTNIKQKTLKQKTPKQNRFYDLIYLGKNKVEKFSHKCL